MKNLIATTFNKRIFIALSTVMLLACACNDNTKPPAKMSKDYVHTKQLSQVRLGDGIPLTIDVSVRWKIEDYQKFSAQFASPDQYDSLILFPRELELANNVSNTYMNVDTLYNSQRQQFIDDLKSYLKRNLGEEGVTIKEVIVSNIVFPSNFLESKEKLALQEQELKTIQKQSAIEVERAEAERLQALAQGQVAMTNAEVEAKVQKIKAETEQSVRASRLAKAETEKQVAKMQAESDATRKKLLAKAELEEKTDLKDLEIKKEEDLARVNFDKELRMAKLCSENPTYATYMVNKELASKVKIAVLPNNQDAAIFNNLLGNTTH